MADKIRASGFSVWLLGISVALRIGLGISPPNLVKDLSKIRTKK